MRRLFPVLLAVLITASTFVISFYNPPIDAYFLAYVFLFLVLYAAFRPPLKSRALIYGLILGSSIVIALITASYIPGV
mgnify:CR=1 FL=1